jgi:hypothetical protein
LVVIPEGDLLLPYLSAPPIPHLSGPARKKIGFPTETSFSATFAASQRSSKGTSAALVHAENERK